MKLINVASANRLRTVAASVGIHIDRRWIVRITAKRVMKKDELSVTRTVMAPKPVTS